MTVRRKDIGAELKAIRLSKEWSQGNVATDANVCTQTISFFENYGPTKLEGFLQVCDVLGILPSTVLKRAEKRALYNQQVDSACSPAAISEED